jgi:DUF4097 and DUF4098 domain-containing protein YvlB
MKWNHLAFGVVFAAAFAATGLAERQVDERVASNHANGKVEIDVGEGSIRVVGWDRNEVHVLGTIGDRVDQLEIRKGRRKVWVRAYVPHEGESREVHLTIHAPHNSDIDVQVFQGPIDVSGIEGDTKLETFSGNIVATGPFKRLEAGTVNGSISVDAASKATGADKVRAKTVTGEISIRNVRREVEVQTISGAVKIVSATLNKVIVETVSGDVQFGGNLSRQGHLQIETHGGDIVGVFPADMSAEFDVTSYNGLVENAFSLESGNSRDLVSAEEDPQAEVEVTSFSGSIRVLKQPKPKAGASKTAQANPPPIKQPL